MIGTMNKKECVLKTESGFTLIEMLIVIIILGILAMVIIPQITVSTEDAKLSTLQANLTGIRNSVETYYVQHGNVYPGVKKTDGTVSASDADSATAFAAQLTQYTAFSGAVQNTKDGTYKYGPYMKGGKLPGNPYDDGASDVTCDYDEGNITVRTADATSAWKFYPKTGVFIANDSSANAAY
ncbi:prepilin-type N-terminal cleavage/methylation domain-containing protein [Thermodesulfobacteriota bacterium]